MNVWITGGRGYLGRKLPFGRPLGKHDLDVTREADCLRFAKSQRPDAIIHLAALDIRQSEAQPELARSVHVEGAKNVARACEAVGAHLVFLSTGAVFSGAPHQAFSEADIPKPLNLYGKLKLEAEGSVQRECQKTLVVRTGWIFGLGSESRYFDRTLERLKKQRAVEASTDTYGSPTYVHDLSQALWKFLEMRELGLVHLVNQRAVTPFAFISEMKELLNSSSKLIPTTRQIQAMERSPSEALISERYPLRPWREALVDWLNEETTSAKGSPSA